MTKQEFLNKYNPEQTISRALSRSINAAVQHNKLYLTKDWLERSNVRAFWANCLKDLEQRFIKDAVWTDKRYEDEILALKRKMNLRFNSVINFKVSHAQKSMGVYFKHLWCMDIIQTPPQAPIDRIILTKAKAPYSERGWTHVNDIETHRAKYEFLRSAAENEKFGNVSEWELSSFN